MLFEFGDVGDVDDGIRVVFVARLYQTLYNHFFIFGRRVKTVGPRQVDQFGVAAIGKFERPGFFIDGNAREIAYFLL